MCIVAILVADKIHTNDIIIAANSEFAYIIAHARQFKEYKNNCMNRDNDIVIICCYNPKQINSWRI